MRSSLLSFRFNEAWRWGFQVWLVVRVILTAIGLVLYVTQSIPDHSPYGDLYLGVTPIRDGWAGAFLGVWQRWDAVSYMHIVEHGYSTAMFTAYFPLYPLLGRLLSYFSGSDALIALLILSNFALILALGTLYQVTIDFEPPQVARYAVTAMAMFPVALYLFAPYAESLAVFLTLLAYSAMKHRHWILAISAGFWAGLAQPSVIPLAALLGCVAWQTIRTNKKSDAIPAVLTALSPLCGLGLFLAWRAANGFPPYAEIQAAWGWQMQWPLQTLLSIPELFTKGTFWIGGWSGLVLLILAVGALIGGLKRLPIELSIYQLTALVFLLTAARSTFPLDSFGRHNLTTFPIYIVLGQWLSRTKPKLLMAISMLLLVMLTVAYIRWR